MPRYTSNGLLLWGSDIDENTIRQAERLTRLPFVLNPVALMPDAHVGKGSTIGSVFVTQGAIIPSAIGVDIGCGMIAVETSITAEQLPDDLSELHSAIARTIPSGVGKGYGSDEHGIRKSLSLMPKIDKAATDLTGKLASKAIDQFGTLGSGNHFVEMCLDERNVVWIVLHSGSRGIGHELASRHIEGAKGLMKDYFIKLEDPDLAYLVEGTPEFASYITDMFWAQEYALANRQAMMDNVRSVLSCFVPFTVGLSINCHHNYTEKIQKTDGSDAWLTRKGAIKAGKDDMGIIPGSMGTATYITKGLGNSRSHNSCSHGAGRKLSRSEAKRQLTTESLEDAMKGKCWNGDARALLDEHPNAYKDIDQVMIDQSDLVETVHVLHQILNYKGA